MKSRSDSLVLMAVVAIAAGALFWILREHFAHIVGYAPYLLFLACPLLHLFMHRGHGHGGRHHDHGDDAKARPQA